MLRLIVVRILETYFRHRFLYLLPIALMAIAAVIFYFVSDPDYISEGVIFVQDDSILSSLTSLSSDYDFSYTTAAEDAADELDEILQTDAFIRSIIEKTDIEAKMSQGTREVEKSIKLVRENIEVQTIGNNQIRIVASNESPVVAQQMANATIDTFLMWKVNADLNDSQAAQYFLTQLVTQYEADLSNKRQNLESYLLSHPEPSRVDDRPDIEQLQIDRLQDEIALATERYLSALDKDENARLAATQAENEIRLTYFLIDAPVVPENSGTPITTTAVNMLIFIVVGILMSCVAIGGAALLDRSIRTPIDVHQMLHLTVLTEVPDITPGKSSRRQMSKQNRSNKKNNSSKQDNEIGLSRSTANGGAGTEIDETEIKLTK